jgi:hypothetical protein
MFGSGLRGWWGVEGLGAGFHVGLEKQRVLYEFGDQGIGRWLVFLSQRIQQFNTQNCYRLRKVRDGSGRLGAEIRIGGR